MSLRMNALCLATAVLLGCTSSPSGGADVPPASDAAADAPRDAGPTDDLTVDASGPPDAPVRPDVLVGPDVPVAPDVSMVPHDNGADVVDAPAPADVGMVECRVPIPGTGCNPLRQRAAPIDEMQVAEAPPVTTAGFYPAGTYTLTSSTVYTGPGGASGPSGLRYAATLDVHGMGSVDYFDVVQEQAGCPTNTYRFTGDTFGTSTDLFNVTWTCPTTCANCAATLPYTGTLTTFIAHFPLPGGRTLVHVYTLIPGT